MRKKYKNPKIEIILFEYADIIRTSTDNFDPSRNDAEWGIFEED